MDSDFFGKLKHPVDFYIIRHGQSEGNAAKILQGRGEYALTDLGRSQAAVRGRSLKTILDGAGHEKILFFSSPMKRAMETADIIGAEASLGEPVITDDLKEMDLGDWTGRTWDQVRGDSFWHDFRLRSWDAVPGAESSADLFARSLRLWEFLREAVFESGSDAVVAVAHGGIIQWLLKSTMAVKSWFPLFPISNCGLFKFCAEPLLGQNAAYSSWDEINGRLPCGDGRGGAPEDSRGFPT